MAKSPKSPADPGAVVVPFGKHKGSTVNDLLDNDPAYVQWLQAQGWLAERFGELHAALAARGAASDDTPEHNALQARFLDHPFRAALLRCLCPKQLAHAAAYVRSETQGRLARVRDLVEAGRPEYQFTRYASIEELREELAMLEARVQAPLVLNTRVSFESKGVDVSLWWGFAYVRAQDFNSHGAHGIELKPALGDDYPSVMRQMRRLDCSVLVVGDYNGRGATVDQLRAMFTANGQTLVFVREIEAEMAGDQRRPSLPSP